MEKSLSYRVAREFTQALDGEDYPTAQSLLAPNCIYESSSGILHGPNEITETYRKNSEKAHRWFENIEFKSRILEANDTSATILFIDHLSHPAGKHTYRCRQKLELDSQGLIAKISHQEIEAERRRLDAYFTQCGIGR